MKKLKKLGKQFKKKIDAVLEGLRVEKDRDKILKSLIKLKKLSKEGRKYEGSTIYFVNNPILDKQRHTLIRWVTNETRHTYHIKKKTLVNFLAGIILYGEPGKSNENLEIIEKDIALEFQYKTKEKNSRK